VSAPTDVRRSMWRSVGRSAGVRVVVLAVSALAGIVITRLVIDHYGEAAYAQYALLVGIGMLLPFADLGMSAVIMNVVAESPDPRTDPRVRDVVVTAVRILLVSMVVLFAVAGLLTLGGWWSAVLGGGLIEGSGPRAAALCLLAFAVALPFGVGQRILSGLGRNHLSVAITGAMSPIVLLVLVVATATGAPIGDYVAVVPYLVLFLLAVAVTAVAAHFAAPAVRQGFGAVFSRHRPQDTGFRETAGPALVQYVALPLAMQTDRLVLSHRSGVSELAQYSLAAQLFTPVGAVVATAGVALWPVFARQRAGLDQGGGSPMRIALVFGAVAAVVSTVLALLSPWLFHLASGGEVRVSTWLVVTFVAFTVVQALKLPLGTFLTDPAGLRFQAWGVALLLPANLGLSWWLAAPLGAVGPILASVTTVAALQLLPTWWLARRRLTAAA
jgi:O-antigen/teichoic acid export membrane protein